MADGDDIDAILDPRRNAGLRDLMLAVGNDIARKARNAAPRRERPTKAGHGADSIRAEFGTMRTGELTVNVSWDKQHFYMSFQEFGTIRIRPKMFLLAAARTYG